MRNGVQHHYKIFGLSVQSELALPELVSSQDPIGPDVVIQVEAIDADPSGDFEVTAEGDIMSLGVPGIARYTMIDGRRILVAARPGASQRDVRLYLLGSAFAAILHQRQLLPLHSNAIEIDGKAVAFLGRSGAGKSTIAAWFHDRGHGIFSDDVCVVGVNDRGTAIAYGGVPRVRLWRDALEASGRSAEGEERAADEWDKYNVRTEHSAMREKAVLSHIYLLDDDRSGAETTVACLSGSRAVQALVENTYRGKYVRLLGHSQVHFDQCVGLAQSLAIFEVKRPWGLDLLTQVGTALEAHARSFIAERGSLDADQSLASQ